MIQHSLQRGEGSENERDSMEKTYLQSTLSMVPIEQQVVSDQKNYQSANMFMVSQETMGPLGGIEPSETHVKIAKLFQTTGNSLHGTQDVEKQLKMLNEGEVEKRNTQSSEGEV